MLRWVLRLGLLSLAIAGLSLYLAVNWLDERFAAPGPFDEERIVLVSPQSPPNFSARA